ncbi:MAG: enoyl-CoA hydratase/isomerase family protein [Acidimicrobiia bacterium]|nr:enoyl-CoA hydratase/isomerase family protein [Acidimicrobiia bacterium]
MATDIGGYRHLLVERDGSVARLVLNRPEKLNALNLRIGVEVLHALDDLACDDDVRAVVLTGAGRAFCAGDDLSGMVGPGEEYRVHPDPVDQYVRGEGRWPVIVDRLRALPKPVIAAVNGHAHGAGFNLALGCDMRIMAAEATLAIPFVKRGLATGTSLLQQYVGIGKAMEWALSGATLDAPTAERWGLASRIVPLDELADATAELAQAFASGPTRVLGLTKAAVYRGWQESDPQRAYEHQGLALYQARRTKDFTEGRQAFLDKRPPEFTGR